MTAIEVTRRDLAAGELRTKDARAAGRMLAIALVLEGVDRATAATACGMDRQTLRDWVHRYNAEGLIGAGEPAGASAGTAARARSDGRARGLGRGRA